MYSTAVDDGERGIMAVLLPWYTGFGVVLTLRFWFSHFGYL